MGSLRDVLVPDIGDFKNIPVIEVLVKPGDSVKAEDSLITLESDKATREVLARGGARWGGGGTGVGVWEEKKKKKNQAGGGGGGGRSNPESGSERSRRC